MEATAPLDCDGLPIPTTWQDAVRNWEKLAYSVRKKWSDEHVAELARKAAEPPPKPKRQGTTGPKFTTQSAVTWYQKGKKWVLLDREHYDHRLKRHHDLQLGLDLLLDDGNGQVGVQAAGVGERAEHWRRFVERGGPEKARRRSIRVIYAEFKRGQREPVKEEIWA